MFAAQPNRVFYSRQIEVLREDRHFHWISGRAIRELVDDGAIIRGERELATGGTIHLLWSRGNRYFRRAANEVVALVEEYSHNVVGAAIGWQGEALILDGFARSRFVLEGRGVREFRGRKWEESEHDLDFIFTADGVSYGVEVKNTLGYISQAEFQTKIRLCQTIGVRPVFALRMVPATWIQELSRAGGFALVFKY